MRQGSRALTSEVSPESVVAAAARDVRRVVSTIRGVSDGSDRANIALIYGRASMLHIDAFFTLLGPGAAGHLSLTAGVHLRVAVELHIRALWASFCLDEEILWWHLEADSGAPSFKTVLDLLEAVASKPELGRAEQNTLQTSVALLSPLAGDAWGVLCSHVHGGLRVFLASWNSFKGHAPFEAQDLLTMAQLGVRLVAHTGVFVAQVLSDQEGYDTAANVLVEWTSTAKSL